jgi:methylthioribose-1-phosphate isomerase
MKINGKHYRTIWESEDIFKVVKLNTTEDFCYAIKDMLVRGAPLIGAAAAYGMFIATLEAKSKTDFNKHLLEAAQKLKATRPTAVNLAWAVDYQLSSLLNISSVGQKIETAKEIARKIADDDVKYCKAIGEFGCIIIEEISQRKNGETVNILTHCNAGWLATVDWGTALAPIYTAHRKGIKLRYLGGRKPARVIKGAKLTAFKLFNENVPNTL